MLPEKITDDVYNNLEWREVDGKELDKIIDDMQIIGSEPIGYPLTEGIVLYLKSKKNNIYALSICYDKYADEEQNPFYINIAEVM